MCCIWPKIWWEVELDVTEDVNLVPDDIPVTEFACLQPAAKLHNSSSFVRSMILKKVFITSMMLVLKIFILLRRSIRCVRPASIEKLRPSFKLMINGLMDLVSFFTYKMRLCVTSRKNSYTSSCITESCRFSFNFNTSSKYFRLAAFIFLVKRRKSRHHPLILRLLSEGKKNNVTWFL